MTQLIVILNDVYVDIMDYIKPATCTESRFRKMWNEFEWNKNRTIKAQMDSIKGLLGRDDEGYKYELFNPGCHHWRRMPILVSQFIFSLVIR